jgi:hypothetical protein
VKKIILLASDGVGVGKTTTASLFVNKYKNVKKLAFMDNLRNHLQYIFKDITEKDLLEFYTDSLKSIPLGNNLPEYPTFIIRKLVNDYSNIIQDNFTIDVWGRQFSKVVDSSVETTIICDDWRREVEYDYLVSKYGKSNIITVHLEKPDKAQPILDKASQKLENQLSNFDFDVQHSFTPDWSNINELYAAINARLT